MTGQYRYKASPPTWWKFNCIVRPRKRKYQQGSCLLLASTRPNTVNYTYLSKLPPVQKVTGIIFEDKDEVDLVFMPYTTGEREEKYQEVDKKKASIDLLMLALQRSYRAARSPVASSWC